MNLSLLLVRLSVSMLEYCLVNEGPSRSLSLLVLLLFSPFGSLGDQKWVSASGCALVVSSHGVIIWIACSRVIYEFLACLCLC